MKIVVAIDSFKGSMSSLQAGEAAAEGIRRVLPDAEIVIKPIADGGEGTVDALAIGMGGALKTVSVTGPLGVPVDATYGVVGQTAIMEMAASSGLALIKREDRAPLDATTYGVGEMIRDAIQNGCRRFIIGIGGSATNDGGLGMLQALGFSFLDSEGKEVPFGAKALGMIAEIRDENVLPELSQCEFNIACDVNNPLCGDLGATAIYGPQKGVTPEMVPVIDKAMAHYGKLSCDKYPWADMNLAGAGAAGGLGFAFLTYLKGELKSGIGLILNEIGLEDTVKDADLVITGEGRMDRQTAMGKVPVGIASLAKKYGKTVLGFAGCVMRDTNAVNSHGIDAFFPITRTPCTLDEAMDIDNAMANMADCVEQAIRLWKLSK